MRVFVSGIAGFLGSHLADRLIELGHEVTGVDTEIMPLLDHVVEIPMYGAKNSLNIASCAPVVLYEILRQWGAPE